jgi:hypothetical protein
VFAVFAPQKYFTIRGFAGIEDSDPLDERESKELRRIGGSLLGFSQT